MDPDSLPHWVSMFFIIMSVSSYYCLVRVFDYPTSNNMTKHVTLTITIAEQQGGHVIIITYNQVGSSDTIILFP